MKRNLLLILAIIFAIFLGVNSARKIMSFHGTAQNVEEAEQKLKRLRVENEELQKELEYKGSDRFVEEEIRNKLGLAKEGETVVIVPKEENQQPASSNQQPAPNWQKWRDLLLGNSS